VGDVQDLSSRRRRNDHLDESVEVVPQPHVARATRHWVMMRLAEAGVGGADNQAVELLAAELVGQALLRSPHRLVVRVRYDGATVRVDVTDDADVVAEPGPPARAVLDALAHAWGAVPGQDGHGGTVWVEVETIGD
jgi:serine/threonine-protein kinase RsbW